MIKLIVVIKRSAAMSPARFHEYWRTVHARKVGSRTAELWFDSIEDKDAFYSDPDYLAVVAPDEHVFADMDQTRFLLTREEEIV